MQILRFYDVGGIHDAPDITGELEEGTDIFPVIVPVTDCVGIFLSPFFPDLLQFRQGSCLTGGIVY